jgi:glycosyltransferase involved in cell wall biosynthesis
LKKIIIVSTYWPPYQNSGVTLSAYSHLKTLVDEGYSVSIIGSSLDDSLDIENKFSVSSIGSAALYSKARVDLNKIKSTIVSESPDLIIVEGWQMSLNDAVIDISSHLGFPVMVFSHGVYLHPLNFSFYELARAFCWLPYRIKLFNRIKSLKAISTLSMTSKSLRFYDRELAKKADIPLFEVPNFAVNSCRYIKDYVSRKKRILVVGYFSRIKNQISAVRMLKQMSFGIELLFVGKKEGEYFEKTVREVDLLGMSKRVSFRDDSEINLAQEISSCMLVYMPSKTEALPITLLEAISSGTPFVATKVGAISDLKGGVVLDDLKDAPREINALFNSPERWTALSKEGLSFYETSLSKEIVKNKFINAVNFCLFE